jgi:hypothetical protein
LSGLQDTQDAQPFFSVGHRSAPFFTAAEEVGALLAERFLLDDRDFFPFGLARLRDVASGPADRMAVEHQLFFPRLCIVEDGHRF